MLLCYHGNDSYRIRQAVCDLIDSVRAQGTALSITHVDCTDDSAADEIERRLKYPAFFEEKTLIAARNAAGPIFADLLERYPLSSMHDVIIVAIQDTSQKSADKKTLNALVKAADTATQFSPLTGGALSDWVHDYCVKRGSSINPATVAVLTGRLSTDTGQLALELDKLCAYARGAEITVDMVRLLTPARVERDEWELSNALASHDKRAAIVALWRRIHEGTPEPLLIGSLASGLRNLLMIQDLTSRKQPSAGIAKLTGLHPFVVSKSLRGAATAHPQRLREAHISLARLERDAKDGFAHMTDGMFSVLLSL